MKGKLQMEWDLTFNSMYKLIILLFYQSLSCFFSYQCNSYKQHLKSDGCGRWECLLNGTTDDM